MGRRALVVGINTYGKGNDLHACVTDAEAMALVLSRHKDGEKNFDCFVCPDKMEGDGSSITRPKLRQALKKLFDYDGEVLLYFSGHGLLTDTGGVLCTSDATTDDWGIPMQEVVDLAVNSRARQILLILDCCHSGDIANPTALNAGGKNPLATIRENMTVIAASRSTESAIEAGGHGLFTAALLDALEGGAADHMGYVTAPALYTYASRRFAAWDQRPVYKTNATEVLSVRECEPLIERMKLRQLATLFPTADFKYPLDPEYEPEDEHGNVKEPVNKEKVGVAQLLKAYRDAGLLRPSDPTMQLYWTARQNGTVELTARGREYWWLLVNGKI